MEPRPQTGRLERPFFYFFDNAHALGEQLRLAAVSLTVAGAAKLVMPAWTPATVGLIAVVAMPFSAYALIAIHGVRGRLAPQRWRANAARTRHQIEESWHYFVRVLVAWAAAQFIAPWAGPAAGWVAALLPVILYVLQARPYHDMHVIMHARGHVLEPGDERFVSRERDQGSETRAAALAELGSGSARVDRAGSALAELGSGSAGGDRAGSARSQPARAGPPGWPLARVNRDLRDS